MWNVTLRAAVVLLAAIAAPAARANTVLSEDFESGAPGWLLLPSHPTETWALASSGAHSGTYRVDVQYDPFLVPQNEWLISPELNITEGTLSFWSFGSVYWGRDVFDNYDLNVYLVVGMTIGDGDEVFVGQADPDWAGSFVWSESTFDLTGLLPGGPVRLGFQYVGVDGAEAALDDITVVGAFVPEPLTMCGALFGAAAVGGYLRRRRRG
jgi:hypothetical protein